MCYESAPLWWLLCSWQLGLSLGFLQLWCGLCFFSLIPTSEDIILGHAPTWRDTGSQETGNEFCCFSLPGTLPHLPSSEVNPCFLSSDLSFDNSDLVMLKSLLAGLSLPSRDGRTDQGLDEEGEGKPTGKLSGGVQGGS